MLERLAYCPHMQFILYYLFSVGVIEVGSVGQSFVLQQYVYRGILPVPFGSSTFAKPFG